MPFLTIKPQQILVILCSAFLSFSAAHAGIYKWVDEQGQTHYGERPVDQSAERLKIKTRIPATSTDATDSANKEDAKDKAADKKPADAKPKKPEPPKITPKEKRARCKAARQRQANMQSHGRLKERDSKGNLYRLSEEQRQARLKENRKNIRKYCR